MKKFIALLFCAVALLGGVYGNSSYAAGKSWPKGPSGVSAEGAVVMDLKSGMILYDKNMDEKDDGISVLLFHILRFFQHR